jgi:PAS domain S-box-containing protein
MVLLMTMLAVYTWRRRNLPGAVPFAVACLFAAAWAIGSVMEYAAADLVTKVFWVKFQAAWQLPVATAITCFVLEYTWPGRWLTRRNLALLSVPPILVFLVILTDNRYHLAWRGFTFAESIQPQFSSVGWIAYAYIFGVLGTINLVIFGWLFLRSPQHRLPVVLMLVGQFGGRILYMLERTGLLHSILPIDLLGMAFEFLMYALALFGFRILDPIPLARQTTIEQLHAGMLVLDTQGKIVNLNPAASSILGMPAKHLLGRPIQELLPIGIELAADIQVSGTEQLEINLPGPQRDGVGVRSEPRAYQLEVSSLNDWRGLVVGYLLLLHDVTAKKQAQAKFLEQQRALAIMAERERLARELHDDLGQVLAFISTQGHVVQELLDRGEVATAGSYVARLIEAADEADTDIRESILSLRSPFSSQGLIPALQGYLRHYEQRYGLRIEVLLPEHGLDWTLEPVAEVQVLRILQEGLANARKHSGAHCVQVAFTHLDGRIQITLRDDGQGFEPGKLQDDRPCGFGLQFMRERAEAIGGSVEVRSVPGEGTEIMLVVLLKENHA